MLKKPLPRQEKGLAMGDFPDPSLMKDSFWAASQVLAGEVGEDGFYKVSQAGQEEDGRSGGVRPFERLDSHIYIFGDTGHLALTPSNPGQPG